MGLVPDALAVGQGARRVNVPLGKANRHETQLRACRCQPVGYNLRWNFENWEEGSLPPKRIMLLPGMDGTGELFAEFIAALPNWLAATSVSYPADKFLSYPELLPLVRVAAPKEGPFVMLAESFSTPLALAYAAYHPPNLAGLIICAGFVRSPVGNWSGLARLIARPWLFRLRPPDWFLKRFLTGEDAPPLLVQRIRRALKSVGSEVLDGRVRAALGCDGRNDLASVSVPMMYMQGTKDRLLAASCSTEISRLRPDVALAPLSAPHLVLQSEPRKAAEIVADFVKRLAI
jgi:pimeloyl-ACP methyl ester carboxylesterase